MTTRTPGRHRAARRPITPLTPLSRAAARGISTTARRGACVAAGSGLIVSLLGVPAYAATAATQKVATAPIVKVDADSTTAVETGTIKVTPAPEPEPVVELGAPEPEPEAEPVVEPAPAAEPKPAPEPQPAPATEPKPAPEPQPAPATEPKPAPEPQPAPATTPKPAPEPQPAPATMLFDGDDKDRGHVAAQGCFVGSGDEAGLSEEQDEIAEALLTEVADRDLPAEDAVITVMTGLTESGLRSLDYGDDAGPDSRGAFQQRASWESLAERMDPRTATGLFLDALTSKNLRLYGTSILLNSHDGARYDVEPWLVAQSVQRSAFADGTNYRADYEQAVDIVAAMLGPQAVAEAELERWSVAQPAGDTRTGDQAPCDPDTSIGETTGAWGGFDNGHIPTGQLCELSFAHGQYARCDAASALGDLNAAFGEEFGAVLAVTGSYRSYEQQVATKYTKGHLAAMPGTSNHGWGTASDLGGGVNRFGTPQHRWMQENAGRFGWVHPQWAQAGGAKPEPWHWEFAGSGS